MPRGWRSLIGVLAMPAGYAAACMVVAAGFVTVFVLRNPIHSDLAPTFARAPVAALLWSLGMVWQAALIGGVLAAPVAVPTMLFFRHRDIRRARAYALGGAGVVAGAALFLHLALGFVFAAVELAVLLASGPIAGLAYWLVACRLRTG